MNIAAAFKLFDIRGEYPQVVDERLAFIIGKSLVHLKQPSKVLVASDTRETSPMLKNFLIDGLTIGSARVADLSEAPISQFYYTMATANYDLGVMVTASHISDNENGFKIANPGGLPFDQGEIQSLKNLASQFLDEPIVVPKTEPERVNNTESYINDILKKVPVKRLKSKIVLDLTKSSALTPALVIFSRLGVELNMPKSDHSGNPLLAQNRQALAEEVLKTHADLGIIWDSDGDRVVFINRQGELIPMSFVLAVLGASEVKKNGGGKVGVDVRAGLVVRDLVSEAGGQIEVFPAWSQYFKFAVRDEPELIFAGETSGHYLFRNFYFIDDGIFTALQFLSLWEDTNLEEKLKQLSRKYYELPETNFPCPMEKSVKVLETLADYYRAKDFQVSIRDGLSVFGADFKFNLRASVTEPFLRFNLETRSQQQARTIIYELEKHLNL